jgi:TRAP-type mannitol/chloroaromatic compound transport system substrate-binding protein
MSRTCGFLIAGLLWASAALAPSHAEELKMISSWDDRYLGTRVIADAFIAEISKATGGKIAIKRSGPEVVPVMQQLQPVSAGVFPLLFSHGGYHAGATGIALALDAVDRDPAKRRESGLWDFVDAHYRKHNIKVIALPVAGSSGYHYFLRKPVTDGFKGLKIRGTTLYHRMIASLGGTPVVLPGTEIYTALEKGVVDGAGWALMGGLDYKWYEVAKYVSRPTYGVSTHLILMNRTAWQKLDAATQKIFLDIGRKIETETGIEFDKLIAAEMDELKKRGVQETSLGRSKAEIEKLWSDGVWQVAVSGPAKQDAEAMRKLALEKGLTQ